MVPVLLIIGDDGFIRSPTSHSKSPTIELRERLSLPHHGAELALKSAELGGTYTTSISGSMCPVQCEHQLEEVRQRG